MLCWMLLIASCTAHRGMWKQQGIHGISRSVVTTIRGAQNLTERLIFFMLQFTPRNVVAAEQPQKLPQQQQHQQAQARKEEAGVGIVLEQHLEGGIVTVGQSSLSDIQGLFLRKTWCPDGHDQMARINLQRIFVCTSWCIDRPASSSQMI